MWRHDNIKTHYKLRNINSLRVRSLGTTTVRVLGVWLRLPGVGCNQIWLHPGLLYRVAVWLLLLKHTIRRLIWCHHHILKLLLRLVCNRIGWWLKWLQTQFWNQNLNHVLFWNLNLLVMNHLSWLLLNLLLMVVLVLWNRNHCNHVVWFRVGCRLRWNHKRVRWLLLLANICWWIRILSCKFETNLIET